MSAMRRLSMFHSSAVFRREGRVSVNPGSCIRSPVKTRTSYEAIHNEQAALNGLHNDMTADKSLSEKLRLVPVTCRVQLALAGQGYVPMLTVTAERDAGASRVFTYEIGSSISINKPGFNSSPRILEAARTEGSHTRHFALVTNHFDSSTPPRARAQPAVSIINQRCASAPLSDIRPHRSETRKIPSSCLQGRRRAPAKRAPVPCARGAATRPRALRPQPPACPRSRPTMQST